MEEVDWLVIAGAALTRSEQEKLARWLGHLSGSAGWPKTPDRDVAPAMDEPSPAPLRVGSFVLDEELVGVLWGAGLKWMSARSTPMWPVCERPRWFRDRAGSSKPSFGYRFRPERVLEPSTTRS